MATEGITKHSVHTLVFRSIKRSHDMFLADHALPLPSDKEADNARKNFKILAEYSHIKDIQQNKQKASDGDPGTGASKALALPYNPSTQTASASSYDPSMQLVSNKQNDMKRGSSAANDSTVSQSALQKLNPQSRSLAVTGESKVPFSQGIVPRKATTMPKPQWHAPWKLMRVVSGHTGWIRCIAMEPGNQWYCTGSADRTIKIWDLASSKLKLSLTGHISTVRGLVVSPRHPYLFSVGEDKTVKCWDLEYNKVTRHYHGHLSAVYAVDIHPTVDVLLTAGRDSTARVWDIRTKCCVHTLTGHTNTIADVKCQGVEPQVITGSHDCTIRYWDLAAGKSLCTLTNHKKSIRSMVLHPTQYTMASASADNIKQWKFPDGNFIQNLGGHNAILNCLTVNSDNVLVSGGDDGSMYFWDWKTGYNFQRLQGVVQPGSLDSENGIFAMTYDLSGTRLLTAEADKTIKIYKEDDTASEETHPLNWRPEIVKRKKY